MGVAPTDPKERIIKLSEGNPGALRVLIELATKTSFSILPDLFLNVFEENKLTGPTIWMLFKDRNDQDINALEEDITNWITDGFPKELREEIDNVGLAGYLQPRTKDAPVTA